MIEGIPIHPADYQTSSVVTVLEAIKAHFREDPRRLFMDRWVVKQGSALQQVHRLTELEFPSCGTIGCIAGWICMLFGERQPPVWLMETCTANQLLGLHPYTTITERLFYLSNWPEEFKNAYSLASTPKKRVEIACNRIDYFINHLV